MSKPDQTKLLQQIADFEQRLVQLRKQQEEAEVTLRSLSKSDGRARLRVGVELTFMRRWGAGPTRDSAFATGNHRSSQAMPRTRRQLPLAYPRQAKREHVRGCNSP